MARRTLLVVVHLADAPLPRNRRVWPEDAGGGAGLPGEFGGGFALAGGELCGVADEFWGLI